MTYPIEISKPSKNHKNFYIYEDGELDPIVNKRFKSIDDALTFAGEKFPGRTVTVDKEYMEVA